MKRISTLVLGGAGLIYGLSAVLFVYMDAPLELQAFIVGGVTATGAGIGWLLGLMASGATGRVD